MATSKSDNSMPNTARIQAHPPLINLGRIKKKRRRRALKQGRGKHIAEVHQALGQVHAQVAGEAEHHPLVISYEQKRRKKRKKKKTIRMGGLKINRRKFKRRLKKSGIRSKAL